MKRPSLRIIFLAALVLACCGNLAQAAQSWIFLQSYYSHDPANNVRIGRQYSRGPVFTRPQGEYINGGYRHIYSTIQVGGRTVDQINQWESWVQTGAQF